MLVNKIIFDELVKRGYSYRKKTRVWDLSDSKLWYLTPGLSKGFLKLFKYEPYRKAVVDTELGLLQKNAKNIAEIFGKDKFNLIDLGCGAGIKTSSFIKSLPNNVKLRYVPIDISSFFIDRATKRIKGLRTNKVLSYKPFVSEFDEMPEILEIVRDSKFNNNLILFLGETISHYDINEFLFDASRAMGKGEAIVIGNGYRVGKRFVNIEKYKNDLFNQWFIQILLALGFERDEISYDARFANGRLEGFYKILVDKKLKSSGKSVYFRKGDEVVVGIQYKYFESELKKFCKMYFKSVEFFPDGKNDYCLLVCRK